MAAPGPAFSARVLPFTAYALADLGLAAALLSRGVRALIAASSPREVGVALSIAGVGVLAAMPAVWAMRASVGVAALPRGRYAARALGAGALAAIPWLVVLALRASVAPAQAP